MTTLALFGATGRTGRHVLEQALSAGYTVRLLSRRADAIPDHDRVTTIVGDVLDPAAVDRTVQGADAVISVFGQVKGSPPALQTRWHRADRRGDARAQAFAALFLCLGAGCPRLRTPRKPPTALSDSCSDGLSQQVLDDAIAHLEVLRRSGLDWTVVRGPRLTNGPRDWNISCGVGWGERQYTDCPRRPGSVHPPLKWKTTISSTSYHS